MHTIRENTWWAGGCYGFSLSRKTFVSKILSKEGSALFQIVKTGTTALSSVFTTCLSTSSKLAPYPAPSLKPYCPLQPQPPVLVATSERRSVHTPSTTRSPHETSHSVIAINILSASPPVVFHLMIGASDCTYPTLKEHFAQ